MKELDPNTPALMTDSQWTKFNKNCSSPLHHVHSITTGDCLFNRLGPRCTNKVSTDKVPTARQKVFLDIILDLVDITLSTWGKGTGKTTFRLMLAHKIMERDNK